MFDWDYKKDRTKIYKMINTKPRALFSFKSVLALVL